jgi:mannose-6-phosphate isomerase
LVSAVAARAEAICEPEWAGPGGAVRACAAASPGDIGVVLTLLLNHVRLRPGEAIYLGAGDVHAYLRGLGVEIMASSDNVLRCGLTSKHVDVDELLAVTDFTELPDPRWPDSGLGGFGVHFAVPVPDFRLHSADLDAYRKPGRAEGSCATGDMGKPYLVLCVSGAVTVDVAGARVDLTPGRAAFVPSREQAFILSGTGQTFLATVNLEI